MSKALSLDLRTRVLAAIAGNSKFSIFDGKINEDVADRRRTANLCRPHQQADGNGILRASKPA